MIAVDHLTKRYRNITAVDGLSFASGARPGRRLARSQRRRQDHHLTDAARPGPARLRDRHHQRGPHPARRGRRPGRLTVALLIAGRQVVLRRDVT